MRAKWNVDMMPFSRDDHEESMITAKRQMLDIHVMEGTVLLGREQAKWQFFAKKGRTIEGDFESVFTIDPIPCDATACHMDGGILGSSLDFTKVSPLDGSNEVAFIWCTCKATTGIKNKRDLVFMSMLFRGKKGFPFARQSGPASGL